MPVLPPLPARLASPVVRRLAVTVLLAGSALLSGCKSLPAPKSEADKTGAEQAEQARQAMRPSAVCGAQQGSPFAFRKKVLVLALPVQRPLEAIDLPDLAAAWSHALQQRLQDSDRFLIRDGGRYAIDPADNIRKQVTTLAQKYDAQIVIAGQVTSLGMQSGRIGLGALGSFAQPFSAVRVIETELDIYDGQSGTRLKRLHHNAEVHGAVENRGGSTLRGEFFRTPLGESVAKMLNRQMEDVLDELACLPMQARIVGTPQKEVQIDIGFTSNLKLGDRLRLLQRDGFPNSEGVQAEKPVGHLVIKHVFPESAIGQVEGDPLPDWKLNGFVRAW